MQCEAVNCSAISDTSNSMMQEEPIKQEAEAQIGSDAANGAKSKHNSTSQAFNQQAEVIPPTQPAIAKEAMIGALLELLKGQGVKIDAITKTMEPQPSSSSVLHSLPLQVQPQPATHNQEIKYPPHHQAAYQTNLLPVHLSQTHTPLSQPPVHHTHPQLQTPSTLPTNPATPPHGMAPPALAQTLPTLLTPFPLPAGSSNRLFIDGIPGDTREREIAHIFRPYPGFRSIRLVPQEHRTGRKFVYCFVDFDRPEQAAVVLHTLQGYRFHWRDKKGLRINYANPGAAAGTAGARGARDARDHRDTRELREARDARDNRDARDTRDHRDRADTRELRDNRDFRDARETRDARDHREVTQPGRSRLDEDSHPGGLLGKRRIGSDYSISYEHERESYDRSSPTTAEATDLSKVTTW